VKPQNNIDFDKIDWSKIDREKAEFFYDEAITNLELIHKSYEGIFNKAIGMLSFSLPVLTALTGYLLLHLKEFSVPFLAMPICSAILLIAILVLLLLILLPKELNSALGEPSTYLTDDYYKNSMENIFKGNIKTLQECINEDYASLKTRACFLKVAIVLFAVFLIISAGSWVVAFLIRKP